MSLYGSLQNRNTENMKNLFKPFSFSMHSMPKYPEFNIPKIRKG